MREQITTAETNDTQSFADGARRYFRMPGIVTAYYPPSQGGSPASVDVQPAVNDVRFDTDTGTRYPEPWPKLYRVPVRFPSFGGYRLWGPLKPGDKVDLESFDLDPGPFLASGNQSDPALTRRNGGAHWVAVPGDYTDPGSPPDPGNQVCLGTPGGVIVALDAAFVNLGGASPADFVALASLVKAELGKIETALGSLSVTTGPGAGGTVVAGTPYVAGDVASKVVKSA